MYNMALTKEQFQEKYNFPKPQDGRDRDMIISSNLSDLVFLDPKGLQEQINNLKKFMWDTEDLISREEVQS